MDPNEYNKKSNIEFSSDQLWEKILEEFSAAYKVLPESQADYGRPTKMAARAYMAKVYLYQSKWKECLEACDEVIQSGKYELFPDFRNVLVLPIMRTEVMAIACCLREVLILYMAFCGRLKIW